MALPDQSGKLDQFLLGKPLFVTDASLITVRKEPDTTSPLLSNRIWLLDDDASMLKALGRLLSSAGFTVEKFSTPAAFLSNLERARCSVAVLDVWMPDMSGLEVQSCLHRESPETRIIFISGRDDPSVRQAALEAGAIGFLAKPFKDETMVDLIHQALAA